MKIFFKYIIIFTLNLTVFSCSSIKKTIHKKAPIKETIEHKSDNTKVTPLKNLDTITQKSSLEITPEETTIKEVNDTEIVFEKFDHSTFDKLLKENISENGEINYKGIIKKRISFKLYLTALSENMANDNWTKEDKLAYWMNAYNAFTIKLIIDNYPTKSIKDIKNAWDSRFFKLGDKWYNLSEIEHKILRKMNDPRIHFGINCASFSCPPLLNRAFTANNVHNELDFLAHQFINDQKRNTITKDYIQLSKIFQWYAKDFRTEGSLIDYLNKYSDIIINNNAKKSYKKYDWNLNETHNGH